MEGGQQIQYVYPTHALLPIALMSPGSLPWGGRWISEQLEPRPLSRAESRTTFSSPSAVRCHPLSGQRSPPPPSKRLNMLMRFAFASLYNYTRLHQEETLTHRPGSRHPSISRRQQETLQRGSDKQWGLMCTSATCTPVRKSRIIIFL